MKEKTNKIISYIVAITFIIISGFVFYDAYKCAEKKIHLSYPSFFLPIALIIIVGTLVGGIIVNYRIGGGK